MAYGLGDCFHWERREARPRFRVLEGFRVLGVLGVLGFRVLGFWVLGFLGF